MARTQSEIYTEIEAAVGADTELQYIAINPSKTAIWRLFAWLVSGAIYVLETLFDAFKIEVNTAALSAQTGNAAWYRKQILAFQYGDNLTLQNDKYVYSSIDTDKQIIKRAAIEERNDGSIRVKVAKSLSGSLAALDNDEIAALISYIKKIRFAGTRFQVFSNNGDILKISIAIYYDPIIALETVKTTVKNAVTNYIQNLPFNGELQLSKLTDQIQAVNGVNDVVISSAASKFSVSDAYTDINRTVIAIGGYFNVSTLTGETLDDTITYIPL